MRCSSIAVFLACWLAGVSIALAGLSKSPTDGSLESRADRAFVKGDYVNALPLLRAVALQAQDDPGKLGSVQARIRICEKALLKEARQVPTAPGERAIHPPPEPGKVAELSIKELGNFDYDPDKGGIPDDVKRLSGSKVRLKGFMIPQSQVVKITRFSLVPSLYSCCFGRPPQVQHTITVICPDTRPVEYVTDEVVVEGTLTVNQIKDDGYVTSIFQLEASSMTVAPK
jgi:hypothetical protein